MAVSTALWTGTLTADQVFSTFGTVSGGAVVLTFQGGEVLRLHNLTDLHLAAQAMDLF